MVRMFAKVALPAIALLAVALVAPQAKAQQDFNCGGSSVFSCSGNIHVTASSGSITNASTTGSGITGFSTSSPWLLGGTSQVGQDFTLTFSTNTGNISLSDGSFTVTGTITSFAGVSAKTGGSLALSIAWNLPGAPSFGSVDFTYDSTGKCMTGSVYSSDIGVGVGVTPEPASLLLLGTGLLGMGTVVRRRWIG